MQNIDDTNDFMISNKRMSDRLREARLAAGYASATEAASAMGKPSPTYLSHENATRGFTREATSYARFFSVRLEWLIDGRGPMKPNQAEQDLRLGLTEEEYRELENYRDWLVQKRGPKL